MESIWNRDFNLNTLAWKNIYNQKIHEIKLRKISEFNFKLLNNIVPCGYIVSKWENKVSRFCDVCGQVETVKHLLFDCDRINILWQEISNKLKIRITWKHVVCGYPNFESTIKIRSLNYIISIIAYVIFRENVACKFDNVNFKNIQIQCVVSSCVLYYANVLKKASNTKNLLTDLFYDILN